MSEVGLLAPGLKKRDESSDNSLALEIIKKSRTDMVKDLAVNLNHKDKNIQGDCIKVLYEIGENGSPQLISPYLNDIAALLNSGNNRLVWGAMIAIDSITSVNPEGVYGLLPLIIKTMENGTAITIDHGVGILAKLSSYIEYRRRIFPLLLDQLSLCRFKQLPMNEAKSMIAITRSNSEQFVLTLKSRLAETSSELQKARLEKLIRVIQKKKLPDN